MIEFNRFMAHALLPLFVVVVLWMGFVLGLIASEWMRPKILKNQEQDFDDYRANLHAQLVSLEGQVRERNKMIIERDARIVQLQNDWDKLADQVGTTKRLTSTRRVTEVLPKKEQKE